jgi:hypothetical protein
MFSHLPPRQRTFVRVALSSAWGMSALAGASSLIVAPGWTLGVLAVTTVIAGIALASMASLAALGVILNRYRMEWVAAWFSAAAFAPHVLAYWYSVFAVDLERLSPAFLMTALVGFYMSRAIMCAAHAERLRLLHEGETKDE